MLVGKSAPGTAVLLWTFEQNTYDFVMATDNEISSGFVVVAGIENILLLYICYITRMLNKTTLFDIFLLLNIKPYVIPKDAEGTFLCKVGD